jgi:hypothetical protein
MAWVESVSPSFTCRHASAHLDDAARVLDSLERTRESLSRLFPRTIGELSVILHDGPTSLALSNPAMPLAWIATAPAARRYVAGWVGRDELHVLAPAVLRERASNVQGSAQMLEHAPASLYARRVIVDCNHDLHTRGAPARLTTELRWAWLFEGASRWFSGETAHARPAIARRLREGRRPSFPPGIRDATLLGGTVFDLIVREEGELAAAQFASRLHPQGPKAALAKVFDGRPLVHSEGAWRSHLARITGG